MFFDETNCDRYSNANDISSLYTNKKIDIGHYICLHWAGMEFPKLSLHLTAQMGRETQDGACNGIMLIGISQIRAS